MKKISVFWAIFILVGVAKLSAQRAMGVIMDKASLDSIPVVPDYGDGGKSATEALKGIYKIDLKPYAPSVRDQGNIQSCVGWAVGYGAYTIQTAIANGWKGKTDLITQNAFSALFIYNQIRTSGCNYGSRVDDALNFLVNKGDLLYQDFENTGASCSSKASEVELKMARSFRIKDYLSLYHKEDSDRKKINQVKLSLADDQPVVTVAALTKNFSTLGADDPFWMPSAGDTTIVGYHAMLVVGFDDGKQAFEVMNSWGPYWGNKGFFWVKYDDFARYFLYGFKLSIQDRSGQEQIANGKLTFRYPINENGQVRFKTFSPIFNGSTYFFHNPWPVNFRFQIVASGLPQNSYLYVFSIDPQGRPYIYWPRQNFSDRYGGSHSESAIVSGPHVNVLIPGIQRTIVLNQSGPQHLCALISNFPIRDFDDKLATIDRLNGSIESRLRTVFGASLAPPTDAYYHPYEMGFKAGFAGKKIIPLILKLEVGSSKDTGTR